MEPGIKEFFKRLATTIGLFVICVTLDMVIGIKLGFAFVNEKVTWANVAFYIWAILSFAALIIFYIKLWKKPIENLTD